MAETPSGRDETEKLRLDRNLGELLQELRVAFPGVQVLFAFLLTVPFQQRFSQLSPFQEKLYFGCLLLTAVSACLMISPAAFHRMTFRKQQKRHMVFLANRLVIAALGCMALAMTGVVVLVTDLLFDPIATAVVGSLSFLMFALLWFAMPLRRRLSLEDRPAAPGRSDPG